MYWLSISSSSASCYKHSAFISQLPQQTHSTGQSDSFLSFITEVFGPLPIAKNSKITPRWLSQMKLYASLLEITHGSTIYITNWTLCLLYRNYATKQHIKSTICKLRMMFETYIYTILEPVLFDCGSEGSPHSLFALCEQISRRAMVCNQMQ